jgi:hypothetical protein
MNAACSKKQRHYGISYRLNMREGKLDHPKVQNLGLLYFDRGRDEEAESRH